MNGRVIVWDLETVPDLRGFAAASDLVGKTDAEVREAICDKFPMRNYFSGCGNVWRSKNAAPFPCASHKTRRYYSASC